MKKGNRLIRKIASLVLAVAMAFSVPMTTMTAEAATVGIDVAKYQGNINWAAVAGTGVKFAFIKAGSTNSGVDPYFLKNVAGAQAAGIRTGVYIYSYATSVQQAQAEAQLLLKWIEGSNINYPVAFDIEDSVQKKLDANTVTAMCNAFGDIVAAAGYTPIIYTYTNFYKSHMTSALKYPKWIAQYADACAIPGYSIWQCTSSGSLAGIAGRVDLNIDTLDFRNYIVAAGPCNIGGNIYVFKNYRKQFGWVDINGTKYLTSAATGVAVTNSWYGEGSGVYYFNGVGQAVIGLQAIKDGIYFFNDDATLYTGWKTLGNNTFLFSPADGKLVTGWYKDASGVYYLDPRDGHRVSGAFAVDNSIYYFNGDGKMQTGLQTINGKKFFFGNDGKMQTGFIAVNGVANYFGTDGAMVTGVFQDTTGTFYAAGSDGHILINDTVSVSGKTFVFGSDGKLVKNQLYTIGKTVYACDENGFVTATAKK